MEVPERILAHYLEHRRNDLQSCLGWLEEDNFSELERVGHQLKGSGATFGFPDLSRFGAELESAAQRGDIVEIEMLLKIFSDWFQRH